MSQPIEITAAEASALNHLLRVLPLDVSMEVLTKNYGEKVALEQTKIIIALASRIISAASR